MGHSRDVVFLVSSLTAPATPDETETALSLASVTKAPR